ncbi:kidney mitochondrial carrier protein 1-like [Lepeophtheirus salmonis]|uniref:kidney mitochondrial carrier protein 1-like n=1 Tax=Lepeophtheirus salmonis TaxID=72036 RepID=UPI001AE11417|nr:kidney mitochondrial carrier protein 1-like [Lepeophtheirus salmonis]
MDMYPFLFGGFSACIAELITFPIDTAKTRLQLQGQRMEAKYAKAKYRGMIHCWQTLIREEGASMLYRGLTPALLRQAVYGTIKYGLYYSCKSVLPGEESTIKNIGCGVVAGGFSSAVANPTDLIKVRMQSRRVENGLFYCIKDIYLKEGFLGLWRGALPTTQRSAIMAAVQLPIYDYCKGWLVRNKWVQEGSVPNHLCSSICAAFFACFASSPFDVIRTRLMDQQKFRELPCGGPVRIYKSGRDCFYWTLRNEGIVALYRGFIPAFFRTGPWNVIFFLVYEELQQLRS